MNARQSTLLTLLLNVDHHQTVGSLAQALGCSEKTVRLDVKALNSFLSSSGLSSRIEGKRGSGIIFSEKPSDRQRLEELLDEKAISLRPRLDRFYRAMLLLICSPTTLTMESLAAKLYTNKQQVQFEMHYWESLLEPFELIISRRRKIDIVGNELAIRFFVLYYLYGLSESAMKHSVAPNFMGNDAPLFQQIVKGAENAIGHRLSSNAAGQMCFYMKVMTARIQRGKSVETRADAEAPLPPFFALAKKRIEQRFPIRVSSSELHLLHDLFMVGAWQWNSELVRTFHATSDALRATRMLADALDRRFKAPVPSPLQKPLEILMQSALTRKNRQLTVPCQFERLVKFDNMDRFLLLSQTILETPCLRELHLFGSDVTRIALVLLRYFDQLNLQRRFRAGLVVDRGIEMAIHAQYRIERSTSIVNITDIVTEQDVAEEEGNGFRSFRSRFDFLIAFSPITCSFPSVCITDTISEADISHLVSMPLSLNETGSSVGTLALDDVSEKLREGESWIDEMRRIAISQGAEFSLEEFSGIAEMNGVILGTVLAVPVLTVRTPRTSAFSCTFPKGFCANGRRMRSFAMLLVSDRDKDMLVSLTEQFRRLVTNRFDCVDAGANMLDS